MSFLLFEISPTIIFLGIGIVFIGLAAAFITFKMLKKTVAIAVRMAIVAAIVIAALIGTAAFFYFGNTDKKDSPAQTPRKSR